MDPFDFRYKNNQDMLFIKSTESRLQVIIVLTVVAAFSAFMHEKEIRALGRRSN